MENLGASLHGEYMISDKGSDVVTW